MIKHSIKYLFVILFILINLSHAYSKAIEVKLSSDVISSFYTYISAERKPLDKFLITKDGKGKFVWICPQILCFPARKNFYLKPCSVKNGSKPCVIFATNRKIKLKSKNKATESSKHFKQGDTFEDVKAKLKDLGFID